jgi:hypothetical protein
MKDTSPIRNITWSLAHILLVAAVIQIVSPSQPVLVGAATQQEGQKSVEEAYSGNPQVKVRKIKIGDKIRNFDEKFDEKDDWPRRLALEVENISTKPITYLEVNLTFPETRSSGNVMAYPITFGAIPNLPKGKSAENTFKLMPGEKLNVSLGEEYERLEKFLGTRQPMNQIHRVQVVMGLIGFEDGTGWSAGDFLIRNPDIPGRWINVGRTVVPH